VALGDAELSGKTRAAIEHGGLNTICSEARCPNRGECWDAGTATFLVLGKKCTRDCRYCSVEHGQPSPPDMEEPAKVAEAAAALGCSYVVVTSVTRDDLPDGGAEIFAETVNAIRKRIPGVRVELLVPDFRGNESSLETVIGSGPDVIGHNLETVERLFPSLRPRGDYRRSLEFIRKAAEIRPEGMPIKSGIMAGIGETRGEITGALGDLREAGVEIITAGQYLRPSLECEPVARYLHPEEFEEIAEEALGMGFPQALCGPLVRSSYRAKEVCENLSAGITPERQKPGKRCGT